MVDITVLKRKKEKTMLLYIPKELDGKLKFRENDVYIKDGVKLNIHELRLYEELRKALKTGLTERIEE